MDRLFVAPIAPGEEWRPVRVLIAFGEDRGRLIHQIDAVEAIWLERRRKNRDALYRFAGEHGLKAGLPKLQDRTPAEERRLVAAWAEADVAQLCQLNAVSDSPQALRKALKEARNTIDNCAIYESEIRIYLRAKNRRISWLLTWLQQILGPEDCPIAERGFVVEPDEAALEAAQQYAGCYPELFAPGCRPRAPELAPDALRKAYEALLVERAESWIPFAVLRPVLGRGPLVGDDVSDEERTIVGLLRRIASEAEKTCVRTLKDFGRAVGAMRYAPPDDGGQDPDADTTSMWQELCVETLRTLDSEVVRGMLREGPAPTTGVPAG
jgi:hypothetical protein